MMRAATQWIMEPKVVLQALVVLTACFVVALIAGRDVSAQQLLTKVDGEKHAGELIVAVNRSIVLRLDTPFKDLLIGNSEIWYPLRSRIPYIWFPRLR